MSELKSILLAEDNPQDAELFMDALGEHKLANRITLVKDGVDAMAYLRCEGKSPTGRWPLSQRCHEVKLHTVRCHCEASLERQALKPWKDIYLIAASHYK